jgi:DNA helicase-2/ATP-dependent DNA helicase PcrA
VNREGTQDVKHLEGLNPEQRAAAEHFEGPLLVLAGAGSGKTRVLTARIAHLVEEYGVAPESILALTFTNKAAGEIRERVRHLLGRDPGGMWIGTFHAIGARMLRRDATRLGWTPSFAIYDADDSERVIRRILKEELNLDIKRWSPRGVKAAISSAKNELVGVQEYHEQAIDPFSRTVAQVYERYQRVLRDANAFDFDDLLVKPVELLRAFPEVRRRYRERFHFVLVDEYQDTNRAQYVFLKLIVDEDANLFVVGDDDQCLVAGTGVTMEDGSVRPVEAIQVGDRVLTSFGNGRFGAGRVAAVHRSRRSGRGIRVTTAGGRVVTSTPEHVHFAGFLKGLSPQKHITYLMRRDDIGFRVGTTRLYTRPRLSSNRADLGYATRARQEGADSLWIIGAHDSENEARYQEVLVALRYGIPTLPFTPRGGPENGLVHDARYIHRLHSELRTLDAGRRLLDDLGYSERLPHYRPQSRNSSRPTVTVTLCADARAAGGSHRISLVANHPELRDALRDRGLPTRAAKRGLASWRLETARRDFGEVERLVETISEATGAVPAYFARLGGVTEQHGQATALPLVPATAVLPGMVMFTADGGFDVVLSVEDTRIEGAVYDLDVHPTHNFVANGLLTHNSIYGWRGADIRNILDFEKDFPDAGTVRLEENYRSTQRILHAANRVIAENVRRKGKTLRTANAEGERLTLVEVGDEADEAEWVAEEIRARLAADPEASPRDFVVLYRTNAQSRSLEESLRREGLPYRIVGGQRFYERREVKDVLAYLRLVANPADDEAFLRIVNVPKRGIGDASIARLAEHARTRGVPLLAAAAEAEGVDSLRGAASRALAALAALLQKLAALADKEISLDELLRMAVAETGLVEALREEGPDGEERIANVEELIAGAADLQVRIDEGDPEIVLDAEEAGSVRPVDLFLARVALVTDADQHDPEANAVSLMTLHNAKGLEFPVVFLTGMEEGLFPLSRVFDEPEQLEEERRLFYVGITRARRKLYLVYARRRRRGREWLDSVASSFLEANPRDLLDLRQSARLRERFTPRRPWRDAGLATRRERLGLAPPPDPAATETREIDYSDSQDAPRLIKGARVRHPQFGSGTVVELSGFGADVRATIDFESVGRKKVVVRYANLEPDWD